MATFIHMEYTYYIGLGGNFNTTFRCMKKVLLYMENLKETIIINVSPVYKTPAWGNTNQAPFLNCCLVIKSSLAPTIFINECQRIEKDLGKTKVEHWGPRNIDIDILLIDNLIINLPSLCVPHKHLHERLFVLLPLSIIAPHIVHPVIKKNIKFLLRKLPNNYEILKTDFVL